MGRPLRKKIMDRGTYYHLYNQVSGPIGDLPFEDGDKEKAFLAYWQVCFTEMRFIYGYN